MTGIFPFTPEIIERLHGAPGNSEPFTAKDIAGIVLVILFIMLGASRDRRRKK